MATDFDLGALPEKVTGSCQCGKVAYMINFSKDHPFKENSGTCQCTQCRKSTSSLFFLYHKIPYSALTWTTSTETLKSYYCTEGNARAFCNQCGTFMYWRRESGPNVSIAIGTIDPLYLFGEGWEKSNGEVPKGGFGRALANACGGHEWVKNEVPGVTDDLPIVGVGGRGERFEE